MEITVVLTQYVEMTLCKTRRVIVGLAVTERIAFWLVFMITRLNLGGRY